MRLKINDLTVKTSNQTLLQPITLDLSFEACGLFGKSGSGKTTLLNALFALDQGLIYQGEVHFFHDGDKPFQPQFGAGVYFIPQNAHHYFDPNLKMKRQLMASFLTLGLSKETAHHKVMQLLDKCHLPYKILKRYPDELSGGMLQRCILGLALEIKPNLIIADEPTSSLDKENRETVMAMLMELKKMGSAIIMATHRLEDIEMLCDQVIVMNQGKIEGMSPAREIRQAHLAYIDEVIHAQRKLKQRARDFIPAKEPLLKITNVSKEYTNGFWKKDAILKDINLKIYPKENMAIMGRSGAGKTTLLKLIAGIQQPTTGELEWIVPCNIGIVFQNSLAAVDPTYTVKEVLLETVADETTLVSLLHEVGLAESLLSKPAVLLSGGQLQRLCLARAIAQNAQLIILDESFSALDLLNTVDLLDLLKRMQKKYGWTYLLVTHHKHIARYLCQKEIYLDKATIQYEGPVR